MRSLSHPNDSLHNSNLPLFNKPTSPFTHFTSTAPERAVKDVPRGRKNDFFFKLLLHWLTCGCMANGFQNINLMITSIFAYNTISLSQGPRYRGARGAMAPQFSTQSQTEKASLENLSKRICKYKYFK